jgi:phospholipid/cholesterol/gamma-HCH transport system permease protein
MIRLSNWLGRQIFEFLESTGRTAQLLVQTLIQLRRINIRHVIYQMAHLGVDTMPIVFMMIVFTGMVMVWQATPALSRAGAQSTTGGLVALAMFRELGPVLSAVVMAGRVGAAITAEIGSMKVTEQIDALRVMATDPIAYLVVPRFVACILMTPMVVTFANVMGIAGGFMVATTYTDVGPYTFIYSIETFTEFADFTGGLIKSMFFGGIVAIVGCLKGMGAKEGAEGVGQATTSSVVTSIVWIFVMNYFLSTWLYR